MVWLKRGLKSSTVKHQHQLVGHRPKHPWSQGRGVSASAVAPLQVQACSGHSWEKVGGKGKKGLVEPICLQTCYLPPTHACINKWGMAFACALKMRWQGISHSAHMLYEQEQPDVGKWSHDVYWWDGPAQRKCVHVCVCVTYRWKYSAMTDREIDWGFCSCCNMIAKWCDFSDLIQNENPQLSFCLAAPFTEGAHYSRL